ncbi:hypothetical protein [Legionella pneumophila]|uniref:hypothetical protein n=1 Tax=Legionella pneumophila TaxID=446 RepID=UPI000D05E69B|nr:hypothetical protein [Legionella pneumophila]HAU1605823.1 hypothetical protein [Legionella pneumophila]HAU1846298.1 hypothetical protein [Legionella pneumophila]
MKKDDARIEILRIWLNWNEPQDKYGAHFGLFFHSWLQKHKPHLMSFRCAGDKYQVINTWVKRWQRDHSDEY